MRSALMAAMMSVVMAGCASAPEPMALNAPEQLLDGWVDHRGVPVDANAAANCLMLADKQFSGTGLDEDRARGQFWIVRLVELQPNAASREQLLQSLAEQFPDFAPGSRVSSAHLRAIARPIANCDKARASFEELSNG